MRYKYKVGHFFHMVCHTLTDFFFFLIPGEVFGHGLPFDGLCAAGVRGFVGSIGPMDRFTMVTRRR